MTCTIRAATTRDSKFLGWVVLAASRSHRPAGVWDLYIDGSEDQKLAFLEQLLLAEQPHWCHHSGFIIAEVEGEPAAALSGYSLKNEALVEPSDAMRAAAIASGWSAAEVRRAFARIQVFLQCLPDDDPEAWIVEWVATAPRYRRRGLVQALLEREFDIGRQRGHQHSQIMILSGNTPAQRAYERAGFRYVDEKRTEAFEEATGSPGLLRMLRPL